MKRRIAVAAMAGATALAGISASAQTRKAAAPPAQTGGGAAVSAADVQAYAAKFVAFDPESKVTVEKAT